MSRRSCIVDERGNFMRTGSGRPKEKTARRAAAKNLFVRPNRSGDADWLGERNAVVANAKDLVRNNELIAGDLEQHVNLVVGRRFRLKVNPAAELLGWDREERRKFIKRVDQLWKIDSRSKRFWMDQSGEKSFTQIVAQFVRTYRVFGEAFLVIYQRMLPEARPFGTAAMVLDPCRVRTPHKYEKDEAWTAGILRGETKTPIQYAISKTHPGDYLFLSSPGDDKKFDFVNRFNAMGREQVVHSYCASLPGLTRGVPIYAPTIKRLSCLQHYQDNVLDNATWQATVAATLESEFDDAGEIWTEDNNKRGERVNSADYHMSRAKDWQEYNPVDMGESDVGLAHLYNNLKLKLQTATQPMAVYEQFERSLIKHVARALGTSYEMLAQDWSKTNFSGARAGMMVQHRNIEAERVNVAERCADSIYCAWLEDNIANGRIPVPGFENDPAGAWFFFATEARDEMAQADWFGPVRGEIDRVKEVGLYKELDKLGKLTGEKIGSEFLDCTNDDIVDQKIEEEIYTRQQQQQAEKDHPDLTFSWQTTEAPTATAATA